MHCRVLSVATVIATIALSACGSGNDADSNDATGSEHTFTNCGVEVTVDATPERVVLLDSGGVTQLEAVGALDKVVATAGNTRRRTLTTRSTSVSRRFRP